MVNMRGWSERLGRRDRGDRISNDNLLPMYFERLLVGNVRHLGDREHDFTTGPGRLRRWNLLPAGAFFLGAPALAGAGGLGPAAIGEARAAICRWTWPGAPISRFTSSSFKSGTRPRNADPASPVRRHLGWCGGLREASSAHCPKSAMRHRRSGRARAGRPDLGRVQCRTAAARLMGGAKSGHMLARTPSTSILTSG
jgi:hypothetical protein